MTLLVHRIDWHEPNLPALDSSAVSKQCIQEVVAAVNEQRRLIPPPPCSLSPEHVLRMCEAMMIQAWKRGYAARVEHENLS